MIRIKQLNQSMFETFEKELETLIGEVNNTRSDLLNISSVIEARARVEELLDLVTEAYIRWISDEPSVQENSLEKLPQIENGVIDNLKGQIDALERFNIQLIDARMEQDIEMKNKDERINCLIAILEQNGITPDGINFTNILQNISLKPLVYMDPGLNPENECEKIQDPYNGSYSDKINTSDLINILLQERQELYSLIKDEAPAIRTAKRMKKQDKNGANNPNFRSDLDFDSVYQYYIQNGQRINTEMQNHFMASYNTLKRILGDKYVNQRPRKNKQGGN